MPLAIVVLRALSVRIPAPDGVLVESHDAPRLFRTIERIRDVVKFPRFHRVLLREEFNAGINQVPRLGLFGWERNYLLLGLPLLMGLSPEQFRAVLAHEFYHLFGAHSRLDHWLKRIQLTWNRLIEDLETNQRTGTFLFKPFFHWYVPMLNAHTYVLTRHHEFEADQFAADLIGARPLADALVALKVKGAFLDDEFWPDLLDRSSHQPEPPENPFLEMHAALAASFQTESAGRCLAEALAQQTAPDSSHPALSDRLASISESARPPGPLERTAAGYFLSASQVSFSEALSARWKKQAEASWRRHYAKVKEARKELDQLEAKRHSGLLAESEALRHASHTELLRGSRAALPLYQEALSRSPENPALSFAAGRILLSIGEAEGVARIEHAIRIDPGSYALQGCELVFEYLTAAGRVDEARAFVQQYRLRFEKLRTAEDRRARLRRSDRYFTHDLSTQEVAELRSQLAHYPQIAAAYLVRKQASLLPENPNYVVFVRFRRFSFFRKEASFLDRLARQISTPRESLSFASVAADPRLLLRVTSVPGSLIYHRRGFEPHFSLLEAIHKARSKTQQ